MKYLLIALMVFSGCCIKRLDPKIEFKVDNGVMYQECTKNCGETKYVLAFWNPFK